MAETEVPNPRFASFRRSAAAARDAVLAGLASVGRMLVLMAITLARATASVRRSAVIAWNTALVRVESFGRARVLMTIALALAAAFLIILYLGAAAEPPVTPQPPPITQQPPPPLEPPSVPAADENPLTDPAFQRILLGVAALMVVFVLIVITIGVGTISLSTQSLAHRRNVMFAFSLLLLAEVFAVDIGKTLSIVTKDPEGTSSLDLNIYAYGILGFFLIYSYVEYCFTFASDYMRTASRPSGKRGVFTDTAFFAIGIYRVIFDILLPTLALAYVVQFFPVQVGHFAGKVRDAIVCKRTAIAEAPGASLARIEQILADIELRFPDAKPAVSDARIALETATSSTYLSQPKAWFSCSQPPTSKD